MGLKLYTDGKFKRTVTIVVPHPEKPDQTLSGNIIVTYNDLDDAATKELADEQADAIRAAAAEGAKGEGSAVSMKALHASLDRVVHDVEGLEVDDVVVNGEAARDFLKKFWMVGKQVNDVFWETKQNPRKRRPN